MGVEKKLEKISIEKEKKEMKAVTFLATAFTSVILLPSKQG